MSMEMLTNPLLGSNINFETVTFVDCVSPILRHSTSRDRRSSIF